MNLNRMIHVHSVFMCRCEHDDESDTFIQFKISTIWWRQFQSRQHIPREDRKNSTWRAIPKWHVFFYIWFIPPFMSLSLARSSTQAVYERYIYNSSCNCVRLFHFHLDIQSFQIKLAWHYLEYQVYEKKSPCGLCIDRLISIMFLSLKRHSVCNERNILRQVIPS